MPTIQASTDAGQVAVTVSATINLGSNANRALGGQIGCGTAPGETITLLTLGGVDITSSLSAPFLLNGNTWYHLKHVATQTGSQLLQATFSGASGFKSMAVTSLYDCDQVTPFTGDVRGFNVGTDATLTLASATGSLGLWWMQTLDAVTLTVAGGNTKLVGIADSFRYGTSQPGASSLTMGGTTSASTQLIRTALSANAPSGGGGSTLLAKLNHFMRA